MLSSRQGQHIPLPHTSQLDIRVAFRPFRTLGQELVHPKDPVPEWRREGVVYTISCDQYPQCYVGQTGQYLEQRLAEHRRALRKGDVPASAGAEHVFVSGHQMDLSKARVMNSHPHTQTQCLLESWHIQREQEKCLFVHLHYFIKGLMHWACDPRQSQKDDQMDLGMRWLFQTFRSWSYNLVVHVSLQNCLHTNCPMYHSRVLRGLWLVYSFLSCCAYCKFQTVAACVCTRLALFAATCYYSLGHTVTSLPWGLVM